MKGVKHVRRWREDALRGELCEPRVVAIHRRRPAGARSGTGEADLVAPRATDNRGHRGHRLAVDSATEEAVGRRSVAVRRTRRGWS